MASVTFTGNTMGDNSFIAIGGIIGGFETNSVYNIDIRNCVNYGRIDHAGAVKHTSMGGIGAPSSAGSLSAKTAVTSETALIMGPLYIAEFRTHVH